MKDTTLPAGARASIACASLIACACSVLQSSRALPSTSRTRCGVCCAAACSASASVSRVQRPRSYALAARSSLQRIERPPISLRPLFKSSAMGRRHATLANGSRRRQPDFAHVDIGRLLEREQNRVRDILGTHVALLGDVLSHRGAVGRIRYALVYFRGGCARLHDRHPDTELGNFLAQCLAERIHAVFARRIAAVAGAPGAARPLRAPPAVTAA